MRTTADELRLTGSALLVGDDPKGAAALFRRADALEGRLHVVRDEEVGAASAEVFSLTAVLPDEFWEARPALAQIRQAAHHRQRSADAVFHTVLARVAAAVPHVLKLPPIIGAPAPLCYFCALVAPSGVGKSNANAVGRELLLVGDHVADQLPLGTGEGLVEVLFGVVKDEKGNPVRQQVRFNAFVYVDEGAVLAELGDRKGATLLPTMRSMWSGNTVGNTNADTERKRIVPAGRYAYGIVVAMLDATAGVLLDDWKAGTPQRFGWAKASDPLIPHTVPEWPGQIRWRPPGDESLWEIEQSGSGPYVQCFMNVAPSIKEEIVTANRQVARGLAIVDPLDSHGYLLRLKVAGLLAVLDGRVSIADEDWRLAGIVKSTSDAVRNQMVKLARKTADEHEHETSTRLARRAVVADEAKERRHVVDCARWIAKKLHEKPDWMRSDLRRAYESKKRQWFDAGLADAVAQGWATIDGAHILRGPKEPT